MKKRALVSVFTVFSILLCCAGIFYLLCTTDPDGNVSDPQAADSVQDTALTDGGRSDENASDDAASNDAASDDASDNEEDDSDAASNDASDNEEDDSDAASNDASGNEEDDSDAASNDAASDKNDAAPEKGVFYSVLKFRRRFPDTDPELLVGKIVNIDKKETVHLRRTTSKNAYLNGRLRLGDKVSVLKLGRNWVKIKKGKKTGYIYYKYIAIALK